MLKIRFGESALQTCDVMLKDMADSKRIDDRIQGDIQAGCSLPDSTSANISLSCILWSFLRYSGLALSTVGCIWAQSWSGLLSDALPRTELKHRAATEYETAFHHFKPDKHLRWVQSLGTVQLSVELEDRVVEVNATPLQASLIELFEQQDYWVVEDLTDRLGVSAEDVEGGLLFWSAESVLAQEKIGWRLLERLEA
jgi:anaphase-promoting complex subunit 2